MNNNEKPQKGKRILLSIVSVLLAIILFVMAGATILADTILSKVNYVEKGQDATVSYEEALALKDQETTEASISDFYEEPEDLEGLEGLVEEESTEPVTYETLNEEELVLEVEITEPVGEEETITNILLIGQDSLKGKRERSDTMILITVNQEKNTITLTSFMRDMYVKIPGYYNEKINSAYMLGGMDLLNETLYQNFGIVVDHNVEVSFGQFRQIIDYLGGITLKIDAKEAAFINYANGIKSIQAGEVHLDGNCALAYARYRDKAAGDFARTERQRKTINALIQQYKNANLSTMIGITNELMGMITTNMTKSEILNYAVEFFPMLATAEIISQRVPFDGKHTNGNDYYYMAKRNDVSVVVPRLPEIVAKLSETLS